MVDLTSAPLDWCTACAFQQSRVIQPAAGERDACISIDTVAMQQQYRRLTEVASIEIIMAAAFLLANWGQLESGRLHSWNTVARARRRRERSIPLSVPPWFPVEDALQTYPHLWAFPCLQFCVHVCQFSFLLIAHRPLTEDFAQPFFCVFPGGKWILFVVCVCVCTRVWLCGCVLLWALASVSW